VSACSRHVCLPLATTCKSLEMQSPSAGVAAFAGVIASSIVVAVLASRYADRPRVIGGDGRTDAGKPLQQHPLGVVALTYNVCFGCMTDDDSVAQLDESAAPLAPSCRRKRCLRNVASVIDKVSPDVAFIQEATNSGKLRRVSSSLSRLAAHRASSGKTDMITFVSRRFIVDKRADGHVASGRPFLILFCRDRARSNHTTVFVNMHRSHDPAHDKEHVSQLLSQAADRVVSRADIMDRPVVVLGADFNDDGMDWWRGKWAPFQYSKVRSLARATIAAPSRPPGTCCDSDHEQGAFGPAWEPRVCDFIMSNASFVKHNYVTERRAWTSDHLPVACELDF
jgi:endonuclease/exonuclease/phosphatase family metal-dependent hydrolase